MGLEYVFWLIWGICSITMTLLMASWRPGFYRKQITNYHKRAIDKTNSDIADSIGKELALPNEVPPVYETYDHPAPPIALLGASLPTAPLGYGWEIHVVPNEEENPALRLAMLDLSTSTVIDAIEADLVVVRRWKYAADDTYASFYRRAEQQAKQEITGYKESGGYNRHRREPIFNDDPSKMLGKVMMANLITPMVDWARLITLRYIVNNPDEAKCNYMLIESEGVPA